MFPSLLRQLFIAIVLATPLVEPARGADFQVQVYTAAARPATPALEDLPLLTQITQEDITWTFSQSQRVGRFVNGDYYVLGPVTVTNIQPAPTSTNGRHGSMLNIRPNAQRSGFDSRLSSARYDASLRVYPPVTLKPGNKLVSSRSAGATHAPCVMRPFDTSVSPVGSVFVLTCRLPNIPDGGAAVLR